MKMAFFSGALLVVTLAAGPVGCSKSAKEPLHFNTSAAPAELAKTSMARTELLPQDKEAAGAKQDGPVPAKGAEPPAIARKIKYAAVIQLIADDFPKAEAEIANLVKGADGYVANSDIKNSPGSLRTGSWQIRIPVREFDAFRTAVLKLGAVEKNTTDSQDLTEEFYDLANYIKNRQAEEESLRKFMEKAGDRLDSFFTIRRELNQVHEDIDRNLGRLKLMANLTDMTTVTLLIVEKQKYEGDRPPEIAEAPTFMVRFRAMLGESTGRLVSLFQILALILAALAPWVPLILILAAPVWLFSRRLRKTQMLADAPHVHLPRTPE